MNVKIQASSLLRMMTAVQPAASRSDAVLAYTHLCASAGKLTATCYNGDTAISYTQSAYVPEAGTALVDGGTMTNILKTLEGTVQVRLTQSQQQPATGASGEDGNKPAVNRTNPVHLEWGKGGRAPLEAGDVADFPPFALADIPDTGVQSVQLPASMVREGLELRPFCSRDENRPAICRVAIECRDGELSFVASDLHVLVRRNFAVEDTPDFATAITAPVCRFVRDLCQADGYITIHGWGNGNQAIDMGDAVVRTCDNSGKYPDWRAIIPEDWQGYVQVAGGTAQLRDALQRMSYYGRYFVLTLEEPGTAVIQSRGEGELPLGYYSEGVPMQHDAPVGGDGNFRVCYGVRHLGSVLPLLGDEYKAMLTPQRANVWSSARKGGHDDLVVVMPGRLK